MEFRILGPLEVVHEGRTLPLGGGRERAVLALLLLSANRVVSSERLADDLWAGSPPERAAPALRVFVSRLRKALREASGEEILLTQPPGYMARVEPDALDVARFEALVAQGREHAAKGHHEEAAARLREALALWRGPALADVADAPLARAEAARLEESRLAALEERVEADLACGRHGQLVAELEALTRAHPLRERLWAKRMLALYRAGRQAEALRAYQELRGILGEELGLEPSAALARLEGAILRHDPELEWPPEGRAEPPASPTPGPPRAPAGVVTFLFTDLVGSTELLERLGDDAAEELRRTHFALLRRAVSDTSGEEVKSLGDGLMVAFSSPLAALRCALTIQEGIAEHNRAHPDQGLRVRVGLHAGEPARDEDDFFGTAVVVAKRLCDRAEGGQVLASELVAGLVGSQGGFRFTFLGPVALKGLAAPVPAVAVGWPGPEGEEAGAGVRLGGEPPPRIPMPALLTEIGRIFVGRERELERLEQLWKEAEAGDRRLALFAGEPGVGKTRLAAEFAGRAHTGGATVLAGRCDEDLGVPYQPFVEALRHFVEHTPPAQLGPRLGPHAGELVRLLPDLAVRVPGLPALLRSDPETERYRLFDAVAAWLAAASSDQPVLLVLDDLQWAAKPTLLLLRHVMRSPQPVRLLVLGIYRDTELGPGHPLVEMLADLRRQAGVERLPLSGLDQAAVASFMAQAAGHEMDDEGLALARAIHDETEGNPFFVREVLRHLTETGGIEQREGRWATRLGVEETGIPEGVREVVGRRLSRLSDDANRVLQVAAVAGAEFELAVIGAAGAVDEETLLSALDEAIAARLVADAPGPTTRHRFAHALVRDTLYGELSTARRVTVHRKVAEAIEALHADALDDHLPALAHHWARASATAPEAARAVDYAVRAGDRALAQLAHDEAAIYYASALELLDAAGAAADDRRRLELLISLGEAQRRAGDPAHRQTLLGAARLAEKYGDARALARAALANGRGNIYSSVFATDAERIAVLESAIAAVGEEDVLLRARLLANLGLELSWAADARRRLDLSDEALRLARHLGDHGTLAHVLLARDYTITSPDNAVERLTATGELLALAESLGDPVVASRALMLRFRAAMELADAAEAERCLASNQAVVADLGQPGLAWPVMLQHASLVLLRGDLAAAEQEVVAACEHGVASGQQDAPVFSFAQQFWLRFEQGRMTKVEEDSYQLLERTQAPGVKAMYGTLLAETDRLEDAARVFEELAATGFVAPTNNVMWLRFATECASLCARLGNAACAPKLRSMLEPYADQLVVIAWGGTISGSVAHYLALLASTMEDWDESEAQFAAAAKTHQRIGARPWLARTQMEWAAALLRRRDPGDAERARDLLGQALATGRALGLGNVERRTATLLHRVP